MVFQMVEICVVQGVVEGFLIRNTSLSYLHVDVLQVASICKCATFAFRVAVGNIPLTPDLMNRSVSSRR